MEKEAALKAAEYYKQKQIDMNRPVNPREPLKRTADNNWVHVTCAVFTPEVKFGLAKALSPAEGIPSIPRARYAETCKACKKTGGACVACAQCHAPVHVECAHHAGYVLGFSIIPVKASRRDQHNIVTMNGETGVMSADVYCKEHWAGVMRQPVHHMHEQVDDTGLNALQLYVQNFKQADLTLTGCARKANQISLAAKTSAPAVQTTTLNRRASLTTIVNGDNGSGSPPAVHPGGRICLTCGIDTSPKWYPIDQAQERGLTNGYYGNLGTEAQKFVEQRSFQCHKCKKTNRQPNPHPPREKTAEAEPLRQAAAALAAPAVATPPPHVELGPANRAPYAWSPPLPTSALMAAPSQSQLQAPPAMAPMSMPMIPPAQAAPGIPPPQLPPTIAPRGGPPIPQHPYSLATAPHSHTSHLFGDWHRNQPQGLPQHGQLPVHNHRDINGGPPPPPPQNPGPPLAPPNHLRPPPMASMVHPGPPPPPSHGSYMAQPPYMNGGQPPSPRRHSGGGPPIQNGGPYMPSHHGMSYPQPPQPPHSPEYSNGAPRMSLLRDRPIERPPTMYAPHGSPPLSRDGPPPPLNRGDPGVPPRENRPASGASASPSLRNLLS